MSIEASNAVWKYSRQKSGPLLVLLALADYINTEGNAWPAVSTLAHKTRMSKRNAQRCLRTLVKAGELEIQKNQGRRGSNIYRIRLLNNESNSCDAHVTGDAGVAKAVSSASPTGDISVAQSVSEPKKERTPIVPKGDDVDFWIEVCFKCFGQAIRSVHPHNRRAILMSLPHLKKEHADSLVSFYRSEPVESRKPLYSSRRHSPEGLMRDLPRQLAFAVEACPPPPPPKEYPFTLDDVCQYLREKYGDCRLPRSLEELDTVLWGSARREIYEAMRRKKESRSPNDAS